MVLRVIIRNMSQSIPVKLIQNADVAENRLSELKNKLQEIRKVKLEEKTRELSHENELLAVKLIKAKAELIRFETLNGKKQYHIPGKTISSNTVKSESCRSETPDNGPSVPKKEKKDKETAKKSKENHNDSKNAIESVIDVRKLDFKIGVIVDVKKHPDADTLYVEKIDCGEEKPRTVVSGLVNHIPINEMQDRIVMVLCNLKPVKMRGITSEAMVMCASSSEKVEVLLPPNGAVPGDLVTCEGYPREPEPQLNPKKKIFETCAPDLKTNDNKVACFKGSPLVVPGKGPVVAPTLKNVNVK